MKYKVIDNFLDQTFCENLILEADKHCKNDHIEVLNNRLLLPSTSLAFISLIKKSKFWKDLHDKLNSQEFLNLLINTLEIKKEKFLISNFFYDTNPNFLLKKYKNLNTKKISTIGNLNLFFYISYKFFRTLKRLIKYKLTTKNYVELLYDYSKSPNGYKREVHRDSDSRTIVFLIYLNNLNENGTGGDLKFHKYIKDDKKIPAQPQENDCSLIDTISPKKGRMVIFLNTYNSLHSVSEMSNHNGYRHFLYGSFTLLGKKNNFLLKSADKLNTNFNIFE